MATFAKSTFSYASYAAVRPVYPVSLYEKILAYHQGPKRLCLDLGCGHGLVTRALSKEFDQLVGADPSDGMIKQAESGTPADKYPNVSYRAASAESLPFLADNSVDMVVAGQAAHWFNYPKLFAELQRILRPGATLAFWGYKDPVLVEFPEATKIVDRYAYGSGGKYLGDYWSQPGRSIVQNKLRDIQPPPSQWQDIQRIEYEPGVQGPKSGEGTLFLDKKMTLPQFLEYARTWSAFHEWQQAHPNLTRRDAGGPGDVFDEMADEMKAAERGLDDEKDIFLEFGTGLLLARKK
ncbi:S-adenosyl-L-methionine-dependent methyltransferase [Xylona heveae TC161]|uniref:S-adenosyl-L-methionine-dependent methyltransferase n=1 Tax=Xylona heveae (strain CBS 132557 / TC161) TaxID=1328760 RepID=A0A165IWC8_XYLHT|nr:S-adenosyl-L-methionine-dependent methyltransferase [Xylona heveae TC161]KZF25471.1 S-adenosyl-L-methionine-dependent methyltransferase [Xylona heveae TC161]